MIDAVASLRAAVVSRRPGNRSMSPTAANVFDGGRAPVEYKRYGWLGALWAVVAGSIVALAPFVVIGLSIDWLHLLPFASLSTPGTGWPWRIRGAWTVLADIGPLLAGAGLVAGCIGFYVHSSTGRPAARWPILLCAAVVGWAPIAGGRHTGLLGVSSGLGFLLMWWTTHQAAAMPRPRLPATHRRPIAVGVGVGLLSLVAASLSYSVLHPIRVGYDGDPGSASLHGGVSDLVPFQVYNDGPLAARLLAVTVPGDPGLLRVSAIEVPGARTTGPTIDSLYVPAGTPRITSGAALSVWLRFRGPTSCAARQQQVLSELDVRLRVAGTDRIQKVELSPAALQIGCRPTPHA
jgi:hypothetical protein